MAGKYEKEIMKSYRSMKILENKSLLKRKMIMAQLFKLPNFLKLYNKLW